MLKPNDLPIFVGQEKQETINIDDLVRQANKSLKRALLEASLEVYGQKLELTTTKTRFGGERYWFICPRCKKRCGLLYKVNEQFLCRLDLER